jgi:hypothetical protein
MVSIIDDFKNIATRQRQIAIQEGIILCPTCQSTGFQQYYDEEGGEFWSVCNTCKNSLNRPPPTSYQG